MSQIDFITPQETHIETYQQSPCDDCPFLKASRRESLSCVNMLEYINEIETSKTFIPHSCHKTDKRASGYKGNYNGPIKGCAGAVASAHKSGYTIPEKIRFWCTEVVWSYTEIKTVYKSAVRRYNRWIKKRDRIMAQCGLQHDAHDGYITDEAINANVNEKEFFFQKLISMGFLKPRTNFRTSGGDDV